MAIRYHAAEYTADTLQTQTDRWFPRLTTEEHEAVATVQAAWRRIAAEDLAADVQQAAAR